MTVPGWLLIGWALLMVVGVLLIGIGALLERRMLQRGRGRRR